MTSLTKEYLKNISGKVVFRPKSQVETQYIVQQMAQLGFTLYSDNQRNRLPQAAEGGTLYLDSDKTLMVGDSTITGTEASVMDFVNIYLDKEKAPPARLGPGEIKKGVFAFFPRTLAEATGIIEKLVGVGAIFSDNMDVLTMSMRAVALGLVVREGRIATPRDGGDFAGAKIVTASDLGLSAGVNLVPEQAAVMSAFNEMAARLQQVTDRLEQMDDRMKKMEAEILPKTLEKKSPALPKPAA